MALKARTLEKLNNITLRRIDLIISKSLKVATISNNLIALILDVEFS